jgi:hypothetical protein
VVVLPQAVLHLGDLSKIQGSAGMTAYIAAEGHWTMIASSLTSGYLGGPS